MSVKIPALVLTNSQTGSITRLNVFSRQRKDPTLEDEAIDNPRSPRSTLLFQCFPTLTNLAPYFQVHSGRTCCLLVHFIIHLHSFTEICVNSLRLSLILFVIRIHPQKRIIRDGNIGLLPVDISVPTSMPQQFLLQVHHHPYPSHFLQ